MTDPVGPIPFSIFIIAKNEADRLPRTLSAIRGLSDDVLLVDSGSTDATKDVAASFGVRVIENSPFPGYGEQKRFSEAQCRYDWVLNIDADEAVTPALAEELKTLFSGQTRLADGYEIRIIDLAPTETRPGLLPYSVKPVRLYRRSRGQYNPSTVHDRVDMVEGAIVRPLRHPIHHFPIRSLGEQMEKLSRYSDLQSRNLLKKGRKIGVFRILTEFPLAFLKAYFLRRYGLKGTYGFLMAVNYAYYRLMRIGKAYEADRLK
jgi:glycosyltransferase involved in cell wall biosynthesis